jgi:hypothetical protein
VSICQLTQGIPKCQEFWHKDLMLLILQLLVGLSWLAVWWWWGLSLLAVVVMFELDDFLMAGGGACLSLLVVVGLA